MENLKQLENGNWLLTIRLKDIEDDWTTENGISLINEQRNILLKTKGISLKKNPVNTKISTGSEEYETNTTRYELEYEVFHTIEQPEKKLYNIIGITPNNRNWEFFCWANNETQVKEFAQKRWENKGEISILVTEVIDLTI